MKHIKVLTTSKKEGPAVASLGDKVVNLLACKMATQSKDCSL